MQDRRDQPVHLPGVAEVRRGVALESEHEHLALPDGLVLEFLYDRLPEEELGLRAVCLFDGVLKGFWGNLVHPASVARTLAALPPRLVDQPWTLARFVELGEAYGR